MIIVNSTHFKVKLFVIVLTFSYSLFAFHSLSQGISINITGDAADNSAMLDISSTSQGLLIPRITTTQRDYISSPALSLLIFNTTTNCFEAYVNGQWYSVSCPPACTPPVSPTAGTNFFGQCFIIWNWSDISSPVSYYIGTTNSFGSATNNGTLTSCFQENLNPGTTYTLYVWAYNDCGHSIYQTLTQTTPSSKQADVSCGSQVWQANNLNVGTFTSQTNNMYQPSGTKWCYNDIEANCCVYGGLYQWVNIVNTPNNPWSNLYGDGQPNCDPCSSSGVQGICPSGYHIPTSLEWSRYKYCLESSLTPTGTTSLSDFQSGSGGSTIPGVGPGDKLKGGSTYFWGSGDNNNNLSGFGGLPAGWVGTNWNWGSISIGQTGIYWTATECNSGQAAHHEVTSSGSSQIVDRCGEIYGPVKLAGFSVRCIKD
jgi:uncharacterized protein (TIGR02145 family)